MNYRFHPAAEAEHLEQVAFYEAREAGLGARYREHFLKSVETVCKWGQLEPAPDGDRGHSTVRSIFVWIAAGITLILWIYAMFFTKPPTAH